LERESAVKSLGEVRLSRGEWSVKEGTLRRKGSRGRVIERSFKKGGRGHGRRAMEISVFELQIVSGERGKRYGSLEGKKLVGREKKKKLEKRGKVKHNGLRGGSYNLALRSAVFCGKMTGRTEGRDLVGGKE